MRFYLVFSFLILTAAQTQAYPEMIRFHYVNCSACHVSNSGGGLLNAYGRTISAELLSTGGNSKEARPFYLVDSEKIDQWLNVGGEYRGLQVHQENSQIRAGRYFWMEGNIQASLKINQLTAYASFGQVLQSNQSLEAKFSKYFLSYQSSDELSVRVGRYIPAYGLNIPQHNYLIRQNLNLGPGAERDSADIQWNGETWGLLAGVSKSLKDSAVQDEEAAMNLQLQYNLNDQHKLGLNYWYGEAVNFKKIMLGIQAVLGWSEKFYSLAELDHQWLKDSNTETETKSLYQLLKLGYEYHKGVHFQVIEEWGKADTTSGAEIQNLGAGFLFYPRPHFEFESLWSKRHVSNQSEWEEYAYLLVHFYF